MFPENNIEYYLLPPSGIASALLEAGGAGELPPDTLLVAAVHAKVPQTSYLLPLPGPPFPFPTTRTPTSPKRYPPMPPTYLESVGG